MFIFRGGTDLFSSVHLIRWVVVTLNDSLVHRAHGKPCNSKQLVAAALRPFD